MGQHPNAKRGKSEGYMLTPIPGKILLNVGDTVQVYMVKERYVEFVQKLD